MKLKVFFIFILSILFLSLISAIEFDMKSNFSQGETLMARVSGNFLNSISEDDILFFRNHVRIPLIPFVEEINNDFYIYAQLLGKAPNNYSLLIENARYFQAGQIIERDLRKNFTITENFSDFSIDPGFIVSDNDFSIEVQNLRGTQITVTTKILNASESQGGFFGGLFGGGSDYEEQITLNSGEIRNINFEAENFTSLTLQKIQLSTDNTIYEIPVYLSFAETEEEEEVIETKLRFELSELDVSMSTDSETKRIIYLLNLGNQDLEDIELLISDQLKPYLWLSTEKISALSGNSSFQIELVFSSDSEEKLIVGKIRARILNETFDYLPVTLNFLESFEPSPGEEAEGDEDGTISDDVSEVAIQACSELNGVICNQGYECSGNIEYVRDGVCCLGSCRQIEESSTGKIIGWLIVAVIIGFLAWFYFKRYKGVRRVVDLLGIGKGKR